MRNLHLIARISGERIALPAVQVESVVKVRDYVPVPSALPFIAGLFALRSRVLTLIDCQYFISGDVRDITDGQPAIIVDIDGYTYALLVDEVLDVMQIETHAVPIKARMAPGWSAIATGMLELEDQSMLVVDPSLMVNPAALRAA